MPQSRAEIQRRYRERKKANDAEYEKKERGRKRKAYIPAADLTEVDLKRRRTDVNTRVKKHYARKVQALKDISDDNITHTRQNGEPLPVSFPFMKKGNTRSKGNSRRSSLRRAYITIENLRSDKENLFREKRRVEKRLERMKKSNRNKSPCVDRPDNTNGNLTPKSKTDTEMKAMGLSPRKHKQVRKRLLLSNSIEKDLSDSLKKFKSKTKVPFSFLTTKKYKCVNAASKILGIDRRTLKGRKSVELRKQQAERRILQKKVILFMEREDNSTTLPGKGDAVGKEKTQKMVLNDYLHNLHAKFALENPYIKISRSTFCSMRPKHILLANFCSRRTCLCSRHQNMALKLRAVNVRVTHVSKNPDNLIKENNDNEIRGKLETIKDDEIMYTEWKKVEDKGHMRWKQVQTVQPKSEFIEQFMKDVDAFREHVERVKIQYGQMKKLREDLPDGHVMIWMDFAENFTCTALEEVQSAYWTSDMVTLHTSVIYFPTSHKRSHISVVGVSDTMSHNASTVFAMLKKLIPKIKNEYPQLSTVHYLTDSPTSQYQNKSIFNLLCHHEAELSVHARWDYLEAGHGKGPCDGLGGSVKRSADMAVKRGKAVIQTAEDFYAWAVSETESSVSYYYVSQNEYDEAYQHIQHKNIGIKPVPKTMTIHAAVPLSTTRIAVRKTSCNCDVCIINIQGGCPGWEIYDMRKQISENECESNEAITDPINQPGNETGTYTFMEGEFVAAEYEGQWFVGRITDIDDSELQINFMTSHSGKIGSSFKWPNARDEIWIHTRDVIMRLPEPQPSGKSRRLFKLPTTLVDEVNTMFNAKLNKP
ncbi:MAG: hypothetical protein ABW185_02860 [Sedimenticola sp.]